MLQVEFLNTKEQKELSIMLLPIIAYEKSESRSFVERQIFFGFIIWAVFIKWEKIIKE